MSSIDLLRSNQLKELRKIKKWEHEFKKTNGKKPDKTDIDREEEIKQCYIIYWNIDKQLKKRERGN